jgi:hypothetical protein
MTTLTLTKVLAYDHFTSFQADEEEQAKGCYQTFCGEITGDNEIYLTVTSRMSTFTYAEGGERKPGGEANIHKILKSTIIKRVDAEIEWEEDL